MFRSVGRAREDRTRNKVGMLLKSSICETRPIPRRVEKRAGPILSGLEKFAFYDIRPSANRHCRFVPCSIIGRRMKEERVDPRRTGPVLGITPYGHLNPGRECRAMTVEQTRSSSRMSHDDSAKGCTSTYPRDRGVFQCSVL